MLFVLRLIIGCAMVTLGVGVRMTSMSSPRYVMEGTNITLRCEFDLEGDDLYSLLWWRGGSVLLRYTPPHGEGLDSWDEEDLGEEEQVLLDPISNVTTRPLAWFPSRGLDAQVDGEGGPEALWLLNVGHEASGVYTCEVTAESPPTFVTANASVTLVVIVPPSASPLLQGTAGYVAEGQWVDASCNSAPALPPPALAFYINDRPVVNAFMSPLRVREAANNKVVVSRSVGFTAHRRQFLNGHLALECRVTIDQLVWKATNDLLLLDYISESKAARVCVGGESWVKGAGVALLLLYRWLG
ncbi:uncharacterized protein LOC123498933 [Portunus trituberculatus]|uniref:uncharacterized protein LOC123498933 n=1 Tax=Portunus trituberculatus TaxID=210409 RepID=UPI001E1CB8FF|nr:uncharacterized protein LOC123498933 [Portunus trituberculatus]